MLYLTADQIIQINKATIRQHGGNFIPPANILRAGALDYVVEIVQQTVFGEKVYKEVYEIAAAYQFYIVTGHVFQDGNKRTGLGAALVFLEINHYQLRPDMQPIVTSDTNRLIPVDSSEPDLLYQFTLEMAAGYISLEDAKAWFSPNIIKR